MQQRDQDQSEDYGYDLVHEISAGDPGRRKDAVHHDRGGRGPAPVEPDGDYGYDEAHDLCQIILFRAPGARRARGRSGPRPVDGPESRTRPG